MMRPEVARALVSIALGAASGRLPRGDTDVAGLVWREYELLFRREYGQDLAAREWVDLGGES